MEFKKMCGIPIWWKPTQQKNKNKSIENAQSYTHHKTVMLNEKKKTRQKLNAI